MDLKTLRKKHEMTQKDLADRIGVSDAAIGAWENGRNKIPEKQKKQLSEIFKINPDDIEEPGSTTVPKNIKETIRLKKQDELKAYSAYFSIDRINELSASLGNLLANILTFQPDEQTTKQEEYNRDSLLNHVSTLIDSLAELFDSYHLAHDTMQDRNINYMQDSRKQTEEHLQNLYKSLSEHTIEIVKKKITSSEHPEDYNEFLGNLYRDNRYLDGNSKLYDSIENHYPEQNNITE